jgi:FtsZ-binding cell division protein ZapB
MKVDISEAESNFANLVSGLSCYVMNQLQEARDTRELLIAEITKLREENSQLKKQLEKKECSENCKS